MAKKVINALNGGELSPYLYGRSDVSKYNSGALKCENFIPLVYGGVTRRPAIKHISKINGSGRIIPFYINRNLKYLLVLNSLDTFSVINIFSIQSDGTEEFVDSISTPYILSEFNEIQYVQNNNLLYLAHRNHPLSEIIQTDDGFKFNQTNFTFPPFLPATLGSVNITFHKVTSTIASSYIESNQPYFTNSDIGSHIKINALRTKDSSEVNLSTAVIDNTQTIDFSNSLNVSFSNYTIEVIGLGRFDLYVQKVLIMEILKMILNY